MQGVGGGMVFVTAAHFPSYSGLLRKGNGKRNVH
jgi:hypothetical protein